MTTLAGQQCLVSFRLNYFIKKNRQDKIDTIKENGYLSIFVGNQRIKAKLRILDKKSVPELFF